MINTHNVDFNNILNVNKTIDFSTRYPNAFFVPANSLSYMHSDISSRQIKSLSDSLIQYGFFDPLIINDKNLVLDGTKRIYAAKYAELDIIPVVTSLETPRLSHSLLNQLEFASDFFEYADILALLNKYFCFSRDYLAFCAGLSVSAISNKLRLVSFTPCERKLIISYSLTERHARTLLKLSPIERLNAIKHIGETGLNVAETEEYVFSILSSNSDPYISSLHALEKDILKLCENYTTSDISVDLSKNRYFDSTAFFIRICKR